MDRHRSGSRGLARKPHSYRSRGAKGDSPVLYASMLNREHIETLVSSACQRLLNQSAAPFIVQQPRIASSVVPSSTLAGDAAQPLPRGKRTLERDTDPKHRVTRLGKAAYEPCKRGALWRLFWVERTFKPNLKNEKDPATERAERRVFLDDRRAETELPVH